MKKGIFCISFDIDLLWGRHDLNYQPFKKPLKKARKILRKILLFLDNNEIPATWAIIGHLYLENCSPKKGKKHPEITRPHYSWFSKDWFDNDPCTNISKDPLWYSKDMVDLLRKHTQQEIACHSFSHVIFGDPGCSQKCADSEIKTCLKLAKKENIKLQSFIFPRNKIGHLDVLEKNGFKSYRGPQVGFEGLSKIIQITKLIIPTPPPVYSPQLNNGLLNIPASFYLLSARGPRKYIPPNIIFNKAKLGIDKAIAEGKVFHLWTHLEDFADNYEVKMKIFRKIINYAIKQRGNRNLEFMSMKQITKYHENIERKKIRSMRTTK